MAVDRNLLQGIVITDPETNGKNIERLILGFISALVRESKGEGTLVAGGRNQVEPAPQARVAPGAEAAEASACAPAVSGHLKVVATDGRSE